MVSQTPKTQVSGTLVAALIESLPEAFRAAPLHMLAAHGIRPPFENQWYDTESLWSVMNLFAKTYGPGTVFNIGKRIPAALPLPAHVVECSTMNEVPEAVDKIFHLFHRREDKMLYDPARQEFEEGLGRIRHRKTGPHSIELVAPHLYPPDLTRGIIVRLARKFDPLVEVHYEEKDGEIVFTVVWEE
jgi:hypothetical protein